MKIPLNILTLFCLPGITLCSQQQDLAALQSKLTVDCKSIRGHAVRIVAETGETPFNRDVAGAHLEQVAKYQASMKINLEATATTLTRQQSLLVANEMKRLSEICETIGEAVKTLKELFSKENPDTHAIRRLASSLRNTMNEGYQIHERMKSKLGIR